MNLDIIFALVFYGLLFLYFITHRKKFEVQGKIFVLYKTQLGIKLMDKISRFVPGFWRWFGYLGVVVGFLGMIGIMYTLIQGTYKLISVPDAAPALAPLLPGVQIPGLPTLSFWHWIIAIFILAVAHEFSHGLYARLFNVKVQSSGFAFLGPILAAFVEPDEKQLEKKRDMEQLSVFAAGPFSNIVLAAITFVIYLFLLTPIAASMNEVTGVQVVNLQEGFPAQLSGMELGETIIGVNGVFVKDVVSFTSNLDDLKPGDNVIIETDKNNYGIKATENPNDNAIGYLGLSVKPITQIREDIIGTYGNFLPNAFMWVFILFFWLYIANLGVGLFNLLPLGPVDGGKMFYTGVLAIVGKTKVARKIWNYVSIFVLLLIVINLIPWLIKLFVLIAQPFMLLLG